MIRRLAGEEQYQIDPLERAYRLAALLAEIADHRHLSSALVLKGGTALNLYVGSLERLTSTSSTVRPSLRPRRRNHPPSSRLRGLPSHA